MHTITEHHVNACNQRLIVRAHDEPGPGGARHNYEIVRCALDGVDSIDPTVLSELRFQNGPVSENGEGVNGITHEAVLAILIDRMKGFQKGPYACAENKTALVHLEAALEWLSVRTKRREAQGIEGTMGLDSESRSIPRQQSARDGRRMSAPP